MSEPTRDFGITKTADSPHTVLRSVDLASVSWTEGFWAERFRQCAEVTHPRLYELAADPEMGHEIQNLRIAAGLEQGEFQGTDWQDEWIYKWLEAGSYILGQAYDANLDALMDETIELIGMAQEPDGYISTNITVRGWERFMAPGNHELYNMGHLMTAACAHHRVTGKTSFLDIARKVGDFSYELLKDRPGRMAHFPINPSMIMAGVELYRTTGEPNYLELSNALIDLRGMYPDGTDCWQDRVPLREETQVVGHAVWYTYLFAGATDAYMETGDDSLRQVLDRLWRDLTEKKLYLTGGTCTYHHGLSIRNDHVWEAAGEAYHLPSASAYNETCGQIGNFMWNWRMLAVDPCAAYADVMERTIYNSIISGIGLDGRSWWYTNPLRWHGRDQKLLSQDAVERFDPGRTHICCPSNLVRTVAGMYGYLYSATEDALWVHQFAGSSFDGELPNGARMKVTQETDYPWDGEVKITVEEASPQTLGIIVRVPGWAKGAKVHLNGKRVRVKQARMYCEMRRVWQPGDQVTLSLPMHPRLIQAHPKVEALRNQVAVMRGPLVYCLESPDLPEGVKVSEIHIPRNIKLEARHDAEILGGVTVLEGEARRVPGGDWSGTLYRELPRSRPTKQPIRLIPYFAWANRGVSEMTVFMPVC